MCVVSDQTSEAGNKKYFYKQHTRSCLRCIIRLHEDACIVPTSS